MARTHGFILEYQHAIEYRHCVEPICTRISSSALVSHSHAQWGSPRNRRLPVVRHIVSLETRSENIARPTYINVLIMEYHSVSVFRVSYIEFRISNQEDIVRSHKELSSDKGLER
jgi:hypothetical protein